MVAHVRGLPASAQWMLVVSGVLCCGCMLLLGFSSLIHVSGVGRPAHDRKIAAELDSKLFEQLPDSFLSNHKSPCWHHHPQPPAYAGRNGPLLQQGTQLQDDQHQPQEQELQHATLLCLPYFYVLGGFQSGAYSLYHMLEAHPDIAKGHNPRPHFWAEVDKPFGVYMDELKGAMPFVALQPGSAALGDASESTFAFYMSAGMRGHRMWMQTLNPCRERCDRLPPPYLDRCLDVCWRNATRADGLYARSLGVPNRLLLDTPLIMKGAYQGSHAGVPKLVVMLRNPTQRLYSAFLQYEHYRTRYGSGPSGFLQFVKEQLAAFERCVSTHHVLEECVLQFEGLDFANEQVFFHCDQVLRGMYWVYLEGWMRQFPREQLLLVLSEDFFAQPKVILQQVVTFLELEKPWSEELWAQMQQADVHQPSRTQQQPMSLEAKTLVDGFYAEHNQRLGLMLYGKPVSPWS